MKIDAPTDWPAWLRILAMSVIACALLGVLIWAGGVGGQAGVTDRVQEVIVEREMLGEVHLRPLSKAVDGRWSVNVYFEPVEDDLDILEKWDLQWWQLVDRETLPGYPRMDLQRGRTLPGSPGDDDNPAYYTRKEKLGLGGYFTPEEIFEDKKYWMRDTPVPEDGAHFETWLVRQRGHEVELLVGFEWELLASGGRVWSVQHPRFIEASRYDIRTIVEQSGFGDDWEIRRTPLHN